MIEMADGWKMVPMNPGWAWVWEGGPHSGIFGGAYESPGAASAAGLARSEGMGTTDLERYRQAGCLRLLRASSSVVDAWTDQRLAEWHAVQGFAVLPWEYDLITGEVAVVPTMVLDSATGDVRPSEKKVERVN